MGNGGGRDRAGAVRAAGPPPRRRQPQREPADTRLVRQQLSQPLARPTATGELCVQGRETGGQRRDVLCQSPAAPDRVPLEDGLKAAHTVFSYSTGAADKAA